MKRFLLLVFWCFLTLCASAEETILSFHSHIEVQQNGDLLVTETLRVSSEQKKIRHGVYRDFPQLYRGNWGLREKRVFDVLDVTRDGASEPYTVENGATMYFDNECRIVNNHDRELMYFIKPID